MNRPLVLRSAAAAALIASASPPLHAAAAPETAGGTIVLVRPLTVVKVRDLDFGAIIPSATAGTVTLNPSTGAVALTAGLLQGTAPTSPAVFVGAGTAGRPALIRIPKNPVTLTRAGGTETMTVSNWTLDGASNRRIPTSRSFEFRVGGRLNVAANQAPGTYNGTFSVEVQYP